MLASLIAGERLPRCAGPGPAPAGGRAPSSRSVGRGAARRARARGPVRRPLRLLLAAPRLPGLRGRAPGAPPRRDLPRHRRGQAAAGGLLHRRPAAGAALAALPAGDAGACATCGPTARPATTRWPRRWCASATRARRMASAFRILGRGPALADQVPAASPTGRWTCATSAATLAARPGAHASGDRPLRLLEPVHGHARLHGPARQRGLEGRLAGPGRSGARAAARVPAARAAAAASTDVRVFCPGCLVVGGAVLRARSRGARRGSPRIPRSPAGRSLVLTDEPRARRAQPDQLPVDHVHALRARGRHPRRRRRSSCATTSSYTPPDRDRRAPQARLPGGAVLRSRGRRDASTRRWSEYFPAGGRDGRLRTRRTWTRG